MPSDGKAKIYTFYSYKGGVGRSMALANIAELLYREGLRVRIIDFDLEAPGLEQYFYKSNDSDLQKLLFKRGIIDLLVSYKSLRSLRDSSLSIDNISESSPETNLSSEDETQWSSAKFPYPVEPLSSFINQIYPANSTRSGELSIITAGRRAKEEFTPERQKKQTKDEFALYADRVRSFAWDDFYLNLDGERFFDWFREEAIKDVDIVLIDSRTGVAEMSGVCTYQLADVVVMFVAPNNQNIEGIKKIADSLTSHELISEGRKGRELPLILVPSRVDMSEKEKVDGLSARFRQVADKLISPNLKFDTNSFVDLMIPYIPYYSFVEEIAVHDSHSPAAIEMSQAYEKICRSFSQLDPKVKAKLKLEAESADGTNLAEQQNRVAERIYDQLTPAEQRTTQSLFTRLVRLAQVDEGDLKDRPKNVKFDDLTSIQREVGRKLSEQGLLVMSKDLSGQNTVGLAEEGLIHHWTRFREWIDQDRAFLLWRQNLQSELSSWEKNGRRRSDLLVESKVGEAQEWFKSRREDLNKAESEYLKASLALRWRKLRERLPQVAAFISAVIITLSILYFWQWKGSSDSSKVTRSRQLASSSETLVTFQPELSILLAVEAARLAPTSEAQQALKNALLKSHLQTVIKIGGPVFTAQYSHDGKRIVTSSGGGNFVAQIWQPGEGNSWQNLMILRGHKDDVSAAIFSPDDRLIATASYDETVILWNAVSGQMIGTPMVGRGALEEIDWSSDGTLLAAASMDNRVYVWDARTQQVVKILEGFKDNVSSVSFSPDGRFLAAGSKDKLVRVWDVRTWNEATPPLKGHNDGVLSVTFSEDSKLLVTTSRDNTARIWHTSDWRTVTVFSEHSNQITRASFSPDGKLVVTASADNTAIVWDVPTGKSVAVLRGSLGYIYDASFSPDGKLILTASGDGTARLWDVNPQVNPNSSTTELLSLACIRVSRNMTAEEWRQYMGNEPYHLTCSDIPPPQPTPASTSSPNT